MRVNTTDSQTRQAWVRAPPLPPEYSGAKMTSESLGLHVQLYLEKKSGVLLME